MEVAQLIRYEVHEKYLNWLFREMARRPLAGFHQVSVHQILEVDKEVSFRLAEQTRAGLDVNPDGTFVLDALLSNAMVDPRITMLVMQRQKPTGFAAPETRVSPYPQNQVGGFQQPRGKGTSSKGKGKGQGKRMKGQGRPIDSILPKGLREAQGEMATDYNGKRICFSYNLGGCNLPVNSTGECAKGLHVCARKNCGGNHAQHYAGCPLLKKSKNF